MPEQEATIELTDDAVRNALIFRENNPEWTNLSLRLYIDGKGCDGFDYGVTFSEPKDTDHTFPHGEIDLVVDEETYFFTKGSKIVWNDDEKGKGFIVENPNHRKFRGKFFRRDGWKERLS